MGEKRFEIKEDDLESLENFPLKWRWTDKKYSDLSDEIIARINPVKEEKASEIYSLQSKLVEKNINLDEIFTEGENSVNVQDKETSFVKNWLKTKIGDIGYFIFLSYAEKLSIRTTKEIFCEYWNDFCYPASDDIVISTEKLDWVLMYHHEELFIFRRLNKDLSESV